MSATSNDPTKYYRTGIAIPLAKKELFDKRMTELGIKTVGELVSIVATAPGIVEALKPICDAYHQSLESKKLISPKRKAIISQMKGLPLDVLENLYREFAASTQKGT